VIVERIKDTRAPFYRPELPQEESAGVHPDILTLMKQCWAEGPSERPSFVEVAKTLKTINKGKSALHCIIFVKNSCELKTEVMNEASAQISFMIIKSLFHHPSLLLQYSCLC